MQRMDAFLRWTEVRSVGAHKKVNCCHFIMRIEVHLLSAAGKEPVCIKSPTFSMFGASN